jgi:5-methyltetrahydrofolate--homocysteine methyltransferase
LGKISWAWCFSVTTIKSSIWGDGAGRQNFERAREEKADAIGLSGLITPSLDEMVHVAQEMQREGFELPLLIGGATTSRAHTAVKIAPHYRASTVHVLDASRAVGVVNSLLNEQSKAEFDAKTRADYERLREQHAAKTNEKKLITIEEARARRTPIDWSDYQPPQPKRAEIRAVSPSIADLRTYIDWSPFFHTWELRGRYPHPETRWSSRRRENFPRRRKIFDEIVASNFDRAGRLRFGLQLRR